MTTLSTTWDSSNGRIPFRGRSIVWRDCSGTGLKKLILHFRAKRVMTFLWMTCDFRERRIAWRIWFGTRLENKRAHGFLEHSETGLKT